MDTETIETKKCSNCLKRVTLEEGSCPFCRKDDFIYDGAVIVRNKPHKFNLRKSIEVMLMKQ